MKKLILTIATVLFSVLCTKAQSTMIVHGTSSTKFYLVENNQIYQIFADEIWVQEPLKTGGASGITKSINLSLNPAAAGSFDGVLTNFNATVISCYEARKYMHGSCGPLTSNATKTGFVCLDSNNTACSIKLEDGTIVYSGNGDFKS